MRLIRPAAAHRPRRASRSVLAAMLALVIPLPMSGSGMATQRACHGCAPSVVICGQTLFRGGRGAPAEGLPLLGVSLDRAELRQGRPYVLAVSESCSVGVTVAIEPRGVLTVESRVRATDGRVVAILVRGHRPGVARITVTHPSGEGVIVPVRVRALPNPACVHAGGEPGQAEPKSEVRQYTGFIVAGTGSYAEACGEVAITLTKQQTGPSPKGGFFQPGPEYAVQIAVRGARCPLPTIHSGRRRRCFMLSANISGSAIELPSIADLPSKVQIRRASGESNVLGSVTAKGAFRGTGYVQRGARRIWITLEGALGTITIGGYGRPIGGFQAP
jgi:hypothetical protein